MSNKHEDKIGELITELDTAVGMLLVMAMKDELVKTAMKKVSNVSFELGMLVDEIAGDSE